MKINKLHTFYTVQIPKLHGLLTRSYTLRQLTTEDSPGTRSTVSKGNVDYVRHLILLIHILMPPTSKKVKGHIGFGLFVCPFETGIPYLMNRAC